MRKKITVYLPPRQCALIRQLKILNVSSYISRLIDQDLKKRGVDVEKIASY